MEDKVDVSLETELIYSKPDLSAQIINEEDPEKAKQLMNLFNLNIAKKNTIRLASINNVLDNTIEEIQKRISQNPNEFTHKDLLDSVKVLYDAQEKSGKISSESEEIPTITLQQQNNIVVNSVETLSKDSRDKIANVISKILASNKIKDNTTEEDEDTINKGE